jgi:hypothetical protein
LHDGIAAVIPTAEFLKRGQLRSRIRAAESTFYVQRQCPVNIPRKYYAALDIFFFLGSLLGLSPCHVIMHVAVQLIKGDVTVTIEVGPACP